MSIKYIVASRRMASRMFGIPGYLPAFDFLTVATTIRNARRSDAATRRIWGEVNQNSRGTVTLKLGERGHTKSNRQIDVQKFPKSPPAEKANPECVYIYIWHWYSWEPMSPHTNKKAIKELTRTHHGPDKREHSKTELGGDQNAKCTGEQFVPLGHGIDPKAKPPHPTST